jgi:hypothetical protein
MTFKEEKLKEFGEKFVVAVPNLGYTKTRIVGKEFGGELINWNEAAILAFLSSALDEYREKVLDAVPGEKQELHNVYRDENILAVGWNDCRAEILKNLTNL